MNVTCMRVLDVHVARRRRARPGGGGGLVYCRRPKIGQGEKRDAAGGGELSLRACSEL